MDSVSGSLNYYKGTGYGEINKMLRENYVHKEDLKDEKVIKNSVLNHIKNIDYAIQKSGDSNAGKKVYRGIKKHLIDNDSKTFIERGYSSTSTNPQIAAENYTEGGCCVLSLIIPKNIDSYEYVEKGYKESEILLQRNIEYYNIEYLDKSIFGSDLYICNIRPYKLPSKEEIVKNEKALEQLRMEYIKRMMNDDELDKLLLEEDI
jgi:hypothetical protein